MCVDMDMDMGMAMDMHVHVHKHMPRTRHAERVGYAYYATHTTLHFLPPPTLPTPHLRTSTLASS